MDHLNINMGHWLQGIGKPRQSKGNLRELIDLCDFIQAGEWRGQNVFSLPPWAVSSLELEPPGQSRYTFMLKHTYSTVILSILILRCTVMYS